MQARDPGIGAADNRQARRELLALGKKIIDQVAETGLLGQIYDGLLHRGRNAGASLILFDSRRRTPYPRRKLLLVQPKTRSNLF
jgi:hypothetical protein